MAFQLGDIIEQKEAGSLHGIHHKIACDCWFTSQGRTIPRLIKVMDEKGLVHTLENIQVLCIEEKNYSGIPTVEHVCIIRTENMEETVKLVYNKHSCVWTIVRYGG